jgi:DNA-binding HxlR family transcriptional regulator
MQVTGKKRPAGKRAARPAAERVAEVPATRERPKVDSVERMLAQAGDTWTFLVLREAYFGVRRFDQFQRNLATAPNILTDRLRKLVTNGLLERIPYSERPPRFEYRLTEKGLDLFPLIVLMMRWGDRWLDDGQGAPLLLVHKTCGKVSHPRVICDCCGEPITARDMEWRAGRGAGK